MNGIYVDYIGVFEMGECIYSVGEICVNWLDFVILGKDFINEDFEGVEGGEEIMFDVNVSYSWDYLEDNDPILFEVSVNFSIFGVFIIIVGGVLVVDIEGKESMVVLVILFFVMDGSVGMIDIIKLFYMFFEDVVYGAGIDVEQGVLEYMWENLDKFYSCVEYVYKKFYIYSCFNVVWRKYWDWLVEIVVLVFFEQKENEVMNVDLVDFVGNIGIVFVNGDFIKNYEGEDESFFQNGLKDLVFK